MSACMSQSNCHERNANIGTISIFYVVLPKETDEKLLLVGDSVAEEKKGGCSVRNEANGIGEKNLGTHCPPKVSKIRWVSQHRVYAMCH